MANKAQIPSERNGATPATDVSANKTQIAPERKAATLVQGINVDVQHLIHLQLAMSRQEIHDDCRKRKQAALAMALGVDVALVGSAMLLLMLPLQMHWTVLDLPLWA